MTDRIDTLLSQARDAHHANAAGAIAARHRTPAELELTEALQQQQADWEADRA